MNKLPPGSPGDLQRRLCYWDEGFPALMLTDTALFRNPNYHRHTDTVDTLDFEAMASITKNLVSAMQTLSL